jgi:hypothetical protein
MNGDNGEVLKAREREEQIARRGTEQKEEAA